MVKRKGANKSKAVRDYLKAHPKAMSGEIAAALTKQGIKITPGYVANIKTKLKARHVSPKSVAIPPVAGVAVSPMVAAVDTPTKAGNAVTIEQIKAVGQMVRSVGGFGRFRQMLDVIREVGGLKRLRDILEAMSVTEQRETEP
jgi:hypothetical protein